MNDVVLAANGIFLSQLKVMVMFNKNTKKWAINFETFDKNLMSHEKISFMSIPSFSPRMRIFQNDPSSIWTFHLKVYFDAHFTRKA